MILSFEEYLQKGLNFVAMWMEKSFNSHMLNKELWRREFAKACLAIGTALLAGCTTAEVIPTPTLVDISPTIRPTRTPTQKPTPTQTPTITITPTNTATQTLTSTPELPTYSECGAVLYELLTEKDIYGQNRPTKLQKEPFSNGPLTIVEVSACFVSDEGKKSDPQDIEEGYENKVVFYDIYGQPHIYRIILGGRSLPRHASRDEMIFADFGDLHPGFITYDQFEKGAQDLFKSRGSRQISFEFYVTDDAGGDLSDYYMKVYQNSEIYAQLVEAIKTGEGFPVEVPDGFFIWAKSARFYLVP